MLSFLRRKKNTQEEQSEAVSATESPEFQSENTPQAEIADTEETMSYAADHDDAVDEMAAAAEKKSEKTGFFARLKQGLSKTRRSFTDSLASLVLGRKEIDDDLLEELEMILLSADVGVEATDKIIRNLTDQVSRKELKDPNALIVSLKQQLQALIDPLARPLEIDQFLQSNNGPYVILMVGINGVGKTTTIGKLAKKFQQEGKSVMLAAGDTFRAAAVEQLQTWGERNHVTVVAQKTGADSAAVIFDAVQSAKAKNIDILIADTAGRLHTQSNLMEELKKVKRVIAKVDETAPHEVMLVIDAGTGQNALNQTKQFHEAVSVSGITLTKLDGTAKGGIIFALAEQCQIPIRFIGVGESIDDLKPFDSQQFTEALFENDSE
ncbi:signal recognition particle-docking protein FtsY [Thiomicrorhabdus sp.]|uniref:signal recognition particle-docking protein FtsY n=1 Tax=Thiomicrorhabdus sp. TaxID=2039724 RepID=UPI0029C941D9|nr:signal recognition particle-docking protein FtsY [Thiomicrorhabdus sp.]